MSTDENRAPGDPAAIRNAASGAAHSRAHAFSGAMHAGANAVAGAMRSSAPVLRQKSRSFADWLVSIGWGKFFLLSLLLLILSGLAFSFFFSGSGGRRVPEHGAVSVNVNVVPRSDGSLEIRPADKAGGKALVVIDHGGVRVERIPDERAAGASGGGPGGEAAKAAPAGRGGAADAQPGRAAPEPGTAGSGAAVRIMPAAPADPEKVAQAVEAARDQIESILQDRVDERLRAMHRGDEVERENWLALLTVMFIIASIILKVVLGSKTKAEIQARRASETAAQEGLKRQLAEAQLRMMQAQVEPHFLFNTLASVDYLIETDPARASRMQKNLIQYLRVALPQMREGTSTLGREILQCRSYLEILKVRMDERLHFSINVPQSLLSASFPPMMLLTLVENAIKHGLEPKPEGGSLSVSAVIADGLLRVAVADSGMGFGVARRGGTGLGLANVRERLQALFGAAASLVIDANSDGGTIATIVVPYRVEPGAASAPPVGSPQAAPAV
jgi:signal transduction histidine kinase